MLVVEVGNEHAIEGKRLNPDAPVTFEKMPSQQRVTTLQIPDEEASAIDGETPEQANARLVSVRATTVIGALTAHIAPGEKPSWIATNDTALRDVLLHHYELPAEAGRRPKTWPAA
jgi:hypothetical protein